MSEDYKNAELAIKILNEKIEKLEIEISELSTKFIMFEDRIVPEFNEENNNIKSVLVKMLEEFENKHDEVINRDFFTKLLKKLKSEK